MSIMSAGGAVVGADAGPYVITPTADTYVCDMTNASTGGNETGAGGGLSGADLVLTASAGLAGVSSGFRVKASGQYLSCPPALLNLMTANTTFTCLFHVKDMTVSNVFNCFGPGPTEAIYLINNSGKLRSIMYDDNVVRLDATTADNYSTSAEMWLGMWSDGSLIRAGFVEQSTPPQNYSDFASGKRVSVSYSGGLEGETFINFYSPPKEIGSNNGVADGVFSIATVVISKICLIDNSA